MKKSIIIVSLFVLVLVAAFTMQSYNKNSAANKQSTNTNVSENKDNSTSKNTSSSQINPQAVKIKAEDFKLKDLNGKEVSLSSLKGKNIMLNFFATWCPPCKAEMPDMEKLYKENKDSDLIILAVNLGEDKATVQDFMKKNSYTFPVVLDLDSTTAEKYNVSAIPTTYFIDKEGNIVSFEDIKLGKTVNRKQGAMTLDEMKTYLKNLTSK